MLVGGPLEYTLRRSPRSRGLRVVIHPDRGVVVTVPARGRRGWADPERHVTSFLAEREPWLRRHLARQARDRAELEARGGLRDGAVIRFRGDLHRLRLVAARTGVPTVTRRADRRRRRGRDHRPRCGSRPTADGRHPRGVAQATRPGRDRARHRPPRRGARRLTRGDQHPRPADALGERVPLRAGLRSRGGSSSPHPRRSRRSSSTSWRTCACSATGRASGAWSRPAGPTTRSGAAGCASIRRSCMGRSPKRLSAERRTEGAPSGTTEALPAHQAGQARRRDRGQNPQLPGAGSSIRRAAPCGTIDVTYTTVSTLPSLRTRWMSPPSSTNPDPAWTTSGVQVGSSPR